MRRIPLLLAATALACATAPKAPPPAPAETKEAAVFASEAQLTAWLDAQTAELAALDEAAGRAWYTSSITGTDADFAKTKAAADALDAWLADGGRFAKVVAARKSGLAKDPVTARRLDVLWRALLGKQVDPALLARITTLENEVEQGFNTYRGTIDGKPVTQNQIDDILHASTDSKALKAAWEAQKAVGPVVAPKLRALVRLRNEVARHLGFRDFYALRLAELDLNEEDLLALFDELDRLTKGPFLKAKAEVDRRLAARLGIEPSELMPWHYQNPFFQEAPDVFATGLDAAYETQDTLALCRRFYDGLGLDVDAIIERSDLYEKPGKSPHAFSADLDRKGDIRVLANVVPGLSWQGTMIHELGHAVYDEYIDPSMPWILRSSAHPLTTEGTAMMLERVVTNPRWAEAMGVLDAAAAKKALPEAKAQQAFNALVFSRWTQVMLHFERQMYGNPDQDLNRLWWDLVEKYQGLRRPEGRDAPDYASKIHLVSVPVYYQNYMLGELFASQLHERLAEVEGAAPQDAIYLGHPEVGAYLKAHVFAPGKRLPWPELVKEATGHPLGAEAFGRRFQD